MTVAQIPELGQGGPLYYILALARPRTSSPSSLLLRDDDLHGDGPANVFLCISIRQNLGTFGPHPDLAEHQLFSRSGPIHAIRFRRILAVCQNYSRTVSMSLAKGVELRGCSWARLTPIRHGTGVLSSYSRVRVYLIRFMEYETRGGHKPPNTRTCGPGKDQIPT